MLFFNTLILAISSSIDSLGIGITYGLRKTKLSNFSKLILFLVSTFITLFSGIIGSIFKNILPNYFANLIGSFILITMGLFIIIQTNNKEFSFDFNNSNTIEKKEAFALGLALSLDSLCIGIGAATIGINIFIFSLLVAVLQYLFLSLGNILGLSLTNFKFIPQSTWTKVSGILLIIIGIFRF